MKEANKVLSEDLKKLEEMDKKVLPQLPLQNRQPSEEKNKKVKK